jgi:hypothetical protein
VTAQIAPCPAGHTYQHLGTADKDVHDMFWAHHDACKPTQPAQINATTDQERLRTSPQSPNATHVISSPEDAR